MNNPALIDNGLFLQSQEHQELYERLGQKTWLLQKGPVSSLVTKIEARRGTFFFLPYGPILIEGARDEDIQSFFDDLRVMAKSEGAAFIRVSPYWEDTQDNRALLKKLGFKKAPIHMLAETLWILDLDKKEEELLQGMEKKHRNLVRRAAKDGVEIKKTIDQEAIDRFWELYSETAKRHSFTPYPKNLLQGQLEIFSKGDQVLMLEAHYEGQVLASAMIMYYGDGAAYHHGASSSNPEFRKIPASYLLQWEAIKEAKERGAKQYNFWGVAPYSLDESGKRVYANPKHPFCGITHFKTGFGGRRHDIVPCHDLVLNPKYYLNWAIESARKWKRGF
jgi:peptidoglycan pentaglycine glycine transferase (the first glycine)